MTSAGSLGKITVAGGVLCAVFAGVAPGVAMAQPPVALGAYQASQPGDGSDDGGANDDWTTNPLGGGGGGHRSGEQQGVSQLSDCDTLQCLREQAAKQQQSSGSQSSHIAPGEPNPSGGGLDKTINDFVQQIMKWVKGIVSSSVPSQIPPVQLPKPTVPPMPLPRPTVPPMPLPHPVDR